jgi:pyruvate dehydrogenase E2 component (dihydrolipoamide acetyltransferase)
MATDVPMPKLGLTMEEATIIEWLVDDGAPVDPDVPIMRIETDKTETEVGSPGSGRLHQIGRPGEVFACGDLVGLLLAEGEEPPAAVTAPAVAAVPAAAARAGAAAAPAAPRAAAAAPSITPEGRVLASPNARRVAAELGIAVAAVRGTGPGGRIVSEDVEEAVAAGVAAPVPGGAPGTARAVATVAARNLADLLGVDLAEVPADATDGRVTRDAVAHHVRTLLRSLAAPPPPTPQPAAAPASALPLLQEPVEVVRLSGMRGTIAKRMHASLAEMAQLTLTMEADMAAVVADRATRKADGPAPSFTDYVLAAAARALVVHPRMNSQVTADGIAVLPEVHVGLAVAVDDGLLVPVVRDAAHRPLADLAAETTRLADAARSGTIGPAELEGGTFSVSALGAYGVEAFTPVINPPNAGILGIGRLRDDPVVADGAVSTVKRLTLSLTWDHRVLDGVPAAQFCRTIVELLADPARLD